MSSTSAHASDGNQAIIRPARVSDLDDLVQMLSALAWHHGDTTRIDRSGLEADLFGSCPSGHALVAERHTRLIGCATLHRLYRPVFGERGADLASLFVHPAHRGEGLGRRLSEAAIEQARCWDCSFVIVGAHPENRNALDFYEHFGFERQAVSANHRFRMQLHQSDAPHSAASA